MRRLLAFFALLTLMAGVPIPLKAQPLGEQERIAKLKELDARLTRIENNQKQIIDNQQRILRKLDVLRVWVRRN